MYKVPTVTIGIPAYNEENNIGKLLHDIALQDVLDFKIEKVIVCSDGSTDKTVAIAQAFKSLPMRILDNKDRSGVGERQNQISENTSTDILVVLNADIRIVDTLFLQKLLRPILSSNVDLVSARIQESTPVTFFEKILHVSMKIKRNAFLKYKKGNSIYTCYGVARAFSKPLYQNLRYTESVGEDAYSYLYCMYHKYTYHCAKEAIVLYKLPTNLKDHQKQSIRFIKSKQKYETVFGSNFVQNEYRLPLIIMLESLTNVFISNPTETFLYVVIASYLLVKSKFVSGIQNTWEISTSSKIFNL